MGEKKLYLHFRDEEYGKRLLRVLNSHRHPGLRVEMVTERERFMEGGRREKTTGEYWLTDDASDSKESEMLWVLSQRSDREKHRIGYLQKSDELVRELMDVMAVSGGVESASGAPPAGVYGVYSPGEEGSVAAALLTQELGSFGSCVYVNLQEFPYFYTAQVGSEKRNLGELFFRLEGKDYIGLVERSQIPYGKATRLPTVAHYRDLWDISDADREQFFRRLSEDCQRMYVVVLFNDVREALPIADRGCRFLLVSRREREELLRARWREYEKTELGETTGAETAIIMPEEWTTWLHKMEELPPEEWLYDEARQRFARSLWEEVRG